MYLVPSARVTISWVSCKRDGRRSVAFHQVATPSLASLTKVTSLPLTVWSC